MGSGKDAYEKLKAGASLIQVYSMLVYGGPGLVSRIRHELAEIMLQNGQRRIQDVIGLDHEDLYWKNREERLMEQRKLNPGLLIGEDPLVSEVPPVVVQDE